MNLGLETPTYGSRLTMRRYFGAGNIQPADIVLQKRTQLVFGITILPLHPLTTELREPFTCSPLPLPARIDRMLTRDWILDTGITCRVRNNQASLFDLIVPRSKPPV
jgi:hypothetical protein